MLLNLGKINFNQQEKPIMILRVIKTYGTELTQFNFKVGNN